MDIDDEEYFAQLKLMFNTPGWQIFTAELRDNAAIIGDLQRVKDNEDLNYKKGQLATIGLILNFPDTIKMAEEQAAEEAPEK